tara:strand:+ start:628 stop:903 length:276 start_codon:yes stop_codon:yes gene_type:complete
MNRCKNCNILLTDDIAYSDELCYPCEEEHIYDEYVKHLIEIGRFIQCENCGNIWNGNAQCNCWSFEDIFENEEEYIRSCSPISVTEILNCD